MAESYVEMIQQLRGEIDAYLGLADVRQLQTELVLGLEGMGVQLGDAPASLVTRVLDCFRRGLQSIVEAAQSEVSTEVGSRTAGRRKRWIEELCDLPLVGVASGSVQIQLGEPASLASGLLEHSDREFYEHVIDLLRKGLACASGESRASEIPETVRQPVLHAIRKLVPTQRGVLEAITVSGRAIGIGKAYRVTRQSRARLDQELRDFVVTDEVARAEGVIREVDLDQNTFKLRDRPDGAPELACEFAEHDEEDVKSYLDKRVVVVGVQRTSPKAGRLTMDVEFIEPVGTEDDGGVHCA